MRTLLIVIALVGMVVPSWAQSGTVILSTTTSTQDSGLLDLLVPMFEKKTGMTVKTISVGTGQALALAARGEADVALVHAPPVERRYVEEGKMRNRRLVMYNDFVVIGPEDDPARIKGIPKAVDALKRIAHTQSRFVSRGDKSGTHVLELGLWKQAGIEPKGAWYIESGQGMGQTLGIANDRRAYTITDRGTWLAFQKRIGLPVLLGHGDQPRQWSPRQCGRRQGLRRFHGGAGDPGPDQDLRHRQVRPAALRARRRQDRRRLSVVMEPIGQ